MKPNILVFVTDQQRADWLSCMGHPVVETPNIDAIARRGTLFTRTYCNTPLCMPSRYSMWTGLPAGAHGMRTNGIDPVDIFPTLPGILQQDGYRTISVGKIHLRPWNLTPTLSPNITEYDPDLLPESDTVWRRGLRTSMPSGYFGLERIHYMGGHGADSFGQYANWLRDEHPHAYRRLTQRESSRPSLRPGENYYSTVPQALYYNRWMEEKTIAELEDCLADKPFFLWCSFPDPHFPFGPPAPYNTLYQPGQIPPPVAFDDSRAAMNELYHQSYYQSRGIASLDGGPTSLSLAQIQETMALALGMVKGVDDSIGRIMASLAAGGRLENTIVVFLSDHGELMGDHGLYCKGPFHYEGLLRIPLIIAAPGMAQGQICGELASVIDLVPTLLALAEVDYPPPQPPPWPGPNAGRDIYAGVPRLPGQVLTPQLLDASAPGTDAVLVENDDDVRGVQVRTLITRRHKLTLYAGRPYGELFDLQEDPQELVNRWDDPAAAPLKAELIRQLADRQIHDQNRLLRRIGSA